jgi:hypothetical protein
VASTALTDDIFEVELWKSSSRHKYFLWRFGLVINGYHLAPQFEKLEAFDAGQHNCKSWPGKAIKSLRKALVSPAPAGRRRWFLGEAGRIAVIILGHRSVAPAFVVRMKRKR